MKIYSPHTQRGFTLIEVVVYLALYSLIIGGSLLSVYGLLESNARNETIAMLQEEGDFMIAKIDWILTNTSSVDIPTASGSRLFVTRFDGTQVGVWLAGHSLRMQEDTSPIASLNNSNVSVTHLNFIHITGSGTGIHPESVTVTITASATTSDGHVLSRDFSTLVYLPK